MTSVEEDYNTNTVTLIGDMIKRAIIVDYGTIRKVVTSSIVEVEIAAKVSESAAVITCNYATLATKAASIYFEPKVGDKVILFSPRLFSPDMFLSDKSVVAKDGYSRTSYIAFPLWFKIKDNQTQLQFVGTGITIKSSSGKATVKIDDDGVNITCDSFKINDSFEVTK